MKREAVDSSGIQTVGYDSLKKILEVEFINNSVYRYHHVPELVYYQLMHAVSIGTFFNEKIRDAGYDFEKLK